MFLSFLGTEFCDLLHLRGKKFEIVFVLVKTIVIEDSEELRGMGIY